MKRILCVLITAFLLFCFSACGSEDVDAVYNAIDSDSQEFIDSLKSRVESAESEEKSEAIVYVTPSGKRYHKQTCRYVKNNDNTSGISLKKAERKGYTPCKVCYKYK